MLILRTLSLRDLHGYGIVQFIQQSFGDELLVEEGSLYPALQRLELNGWIDGVWGVTSNNRRPESARRSVRPNEPAILALAAVVLLSAAIFAGYAPARRAARSAWAQIVAARFFSSSLSP